MKGQSQHILKLLKKLKAFASVSQKDNQQTDQKKALLISKHLNRNEKMIKDMLGDSQDLMITKFTIKVKDHQSLDAMIVAIDGIVDEQVKRDSVLKQLQNHQLDSKPNKNLEQIQNLLSVKHILPENDLQKAIEYILKSHLLILIEGYQTGLLITADGFEIRAVTEPETERTVRGPREGFIESLSVNLTLVRRRIRHPSLRFDTHTVGNYTKTDVTIAYIEDIADPKLVNRIKKRIQDIEVDEINNSGDIEQFIEDHPFSIFPTIGNTERPDKVSTMLMEGRVVIFVSGDPVALIAPYLFVESFMNIEDYNSRPFYSTLIRLLRFGAFLISIVTPALYISAINFNKALIPSDLIVPIIEARETVPFPLAMEVLISFAMFEVVREAGVRLPQQVGTAVSIVGPLILGDVAVTAGLIGAPTIIVVSLSYIAAFVISTIADVTSLLRIYLFIAASLFGTFGLCMGLLGLLTHMVSLTSIGIPYLSPLSPIHFKDLKDTFVRLPSKWLKTRPESIPMKRRRRIWSLPDTGDVDETP